MFTGLVEEMGRIAAIERGEESFTLTIRAETVLPDVAFGDSICVEGVCLSVTAFDRTQFSVGLAPETLARTTLGDVEEGARVNLERAVLPTTRLGGHYVQGHVDGTGTITEIRPDADARWITISVPPEMTTQIVEKGYIAVDGTSLTVVDVGEDWFNLTLISHTQPLVTLGAKTVGDRVNLETDIMAKYAEKILLRRESK